MNRYVSGALSGFIATAPMTISMIAMHRRLPKRERYPLPPRQITMRVAEQAGVPTERLDEPERKGLSLAAHFAYGAAAGTGYAAFAKRNSSHPLLKGIGYGLAVWSGSYLGLIPATGLLSSATKQPARRNALMIGAHVIWGLTLAALHESLIADKGRRTKAGKAAQAAAF